MDEGRNGGETAVDDASSGGVEKEGDDFSRSRIWASADWESHAGGRMLARRCFFKRKASQSGRLARAGGFKDEVGPCEAVSSVIGL